MDQQILSKVRLKPRWQTKTKPIRMIKREEVLIFWKLPESSATLVTPPLKQWKNKMTSVKYVETYTEYFMYVMLVLMKTELTLWLLSDSDAPFLPPLSVRTPACYRRADSADTADTTHLSVFSVMVCVVILVSRCNLLSWPRERVTRDFLDNSLYSQSTQWPGWSGRQHVSITNSK